MLACAGIDNIIRVVKTPIFQNNLEISSLHLHNQPINSLSWSSNDQCLISSGIDKKCVVWNMNPQKKGEVLLYMDKQTKSKTAPPFTDEIKHAQFYYSDKIIVLSSGNKLFFYQYLLPGDEPIKDDVKRLQQRGLYKLIQTFDHPTAHSIPSFCFHNTMT